MMILLLLLLLFNHSSNGVDIMIMLLMMMMMCVTGFQLQPKVAAHKIPSTEIKPFKLRSEHRHSEVQEELNKKVNAMETELQKNAQFHARPVPSTTYKPNAIIVDNTERDLVIPMAVTLESDKRALKRQEFDKQMEEKLSQIQTMKALLVRQQRDMEAKRIQEIRRKSIDEGIVVTLL